MKIMESIATDAIQCWGCPVFDHLFQIVSLAAAAAYNKLVILCIILFGVLFAVVVTNTVIQNIRGGGTDDPTYQKTIKPLVINSLIAFALLGSGLFLPRLITQITFEPTAYIALTYTQSVLDQSPAKVDQRVTYQPVQIEDNGFFRPQLRDTILMLMKSVVAMFQSCIKIGLAIMDKAFDLTALFGGPGPLLQHIILFFIGFYLAYGFFKLFINFCFYFVDIIVAMLFFAFFFPFGIMFAVFKGPGVPGWISKLGAGLGASQVKSLINAIISLAAAVLTYTVIIVLVGKFFTQTGLSSTELINLIVSGEIFESDLSNGSAESLTIAGCVVMLYVLNYLQGQIPKVTQMVLDAFDVKENTALSKNVANQATSFVKSQFEQVKRIGKNIISAAGSGGSGSGGSGGSGGGTGGGTTP